MQNVELLKTRYNRGKGGTKKMCVVLSNINIKGGIGKTIGNATMAEILAKCGKRVLLVDNDPQCNMTGLFGMMTDEERYTIKDLYMCPQERLPEYARQMVYPTKYENIDMIVSEPGHRDTISYVEQLRDCDTRSILANAISFFKKDYDYIIIDKNPSADILATNVLVACDEVIAPVEMDGFSYQGLTNLFLEIQNITSNGELNPFLTFRGIYMVKVEKNTNLFRSLYGAYKKELGEFFLQATVRKSIQVAECSAKSIPLLHYKKRSNPLEDYILLMEELKYITSDQARELLKEHATSKEYKTAKIIRK